MYPRARAEFKNGEYFSDETADKSNGITLIPDGTAPAIYGLDALEAAGNLDMTESESKSFIIQAEDHGRGRSQWMRPIICSWEISLWKRKRLTMWATGR